eukprot:5746132-Alexandrium_andersonii.AAC.1
MTATASAAPSCGRPSFATAVAEASTRSSRLKTPSLRHSLGWRRASGALPAWMEAPGASRQMRKGLLSRGG